MATAAAQARRFERDARTALRGRLEARREEIETAALTRVRAISDPAEVADPAYAEGLRVAVAAAVAFGIETTGREAGEPPIPVALLAQARMAARVGIPLDTVLRRYFAGYSLLGYFILEEASRAGMTDGTELKRLLGAHAGTFDRLLAAVGEEHARESETLRASSEQRKTERVVRLLEGEMSDVADIAYDFEGWHLGAIASGVGAEAVIRTLVEPRDCRLLSVRRNDGETVWAWLGTRRSPDALELEQLRSTSTPGGVRLGLGEPGHGLTGWRITHRQAAVALSVTLRGGRSPVRYADVALLATVLSDDLLVASLRQRYLRPLDDERDGGTALRETLRAYLGTGGGISATATTLGVSRRTVSNRLRKVEDMIDKPLHVALAEIEIALRLEQLEAPSDPPKMSRAGGVESQSGIAPTVD